MDIHSAKTLLSHKRKPFNKPSIWFLSIIGNTLRRNLVTRNNSVSYTKHPFTKFRQTNNKLYPLWTNKEGKPKTSAIFEPKRTIETTCLTEFSSNFSSLLATIAVQITVHITTFTNHRANWLFKETSNGNKVSIAFNEKLTSNTLISCSPAMVHSRQSIGNLSRQPGHGLTNYS